MPSYQGELDGLCGPYAIANAFELCGCCTGNEKVFKLACQAFAQRRWPEILWEGTSFHDMQRMIKACIDNVKFAQSYELDVSYPFMKIVPNTNSEYWDRFDEIFDDKAVQCGIIGITLPSAHWIVASRDGSRIEFTDSTAHKSMLRKNRASLYAGERRQKPNQWLIDRKEFIVFSFK